MKTNDKARCRIVLRGCLLVLVAATAQGQFAWTPVDNISASGDEDYYSGKASVVRDMDGHLHCTWYEFTDGTTSERHRYANNISGSWSRHSLQVSGCSGFGTEHHLAVTPDNTIHLIVKSNGIRVASKTPDASTFGNVQLLAAQEEPALYAQDLEVSPGGAMMALYLRMWSGGARTELLARYKPAGGSWGDEYEVRPERDNYLSGAHLATLGEDFVVGWSANRRGGMRVRGADGAWSSMKEVMGNCFGGFEFAHNPQGNELAAIYSYDDDTDAYFNIYCKISTDRGCSWGDEIVLSRRTGLECGPHGVYDDHGNLHAFWIDATGDSHIRYRSRVQGSWNDAQQLWANDHRTGVEKRPVKWLDGKLYVYYNETVDGHEDVLLTVGTSNFPTPQTPYQTSTPYITPTYTHTATNTSTHTATVTNTSRFGSATSTPTNTMQPSPSLTPTATATSASGAGGVSLW